MKIKIPELSLVVLIGASGAGKSWFGRKAFKPTEVLSSDFFRGLVSDDENDQSATKDAFEALYYIAAKRLAAGRLTVVDATNVYADARKPLVALAREYHCLPVAIVLDTPEKLCAERNEDRPDRNFSSRVIRRHAQQLRRSKKSLKREGFRHVFYLNSEEDVDSAVIERQPLWNNLRHDHGPFDIIGDVHGCYSELRALLEKIGYQIYESRIDGEDTEFSVTNPDDRKVIFLGDIVDRGPEVVKTLRLVMCMVEGGTALCVPGNHDMKLLKFLRGKKVQVKHGLEESIKELETASPEFKEKLAAFLDGMVSHYMLDGGQLVVAHAGMREDMQGRGSGKVREFAQYGETTGEIDEFGLPVRYDWASEYRGEATVVYGHTPVPQPEWLNRTINIDTGCVFGGQLTALRWPEKELVAIPAEKVYAESVKSLLEENGEGAQLTAQQGHDDLLDLADVTGKQIIHTRLHHTVTILEENSIVALEVMTCFAVNPKWLIYMPPTMSPCKTSKRDGLLEHPEEAFDYYRSKGVTQAVCEEKHMGSRVVIVICRDETVALRRFGVENSPAAGVCYTRTGRPFFKNEAMEIALLDKLRKAMDASGFWEKHETDWACLDCELMPWSAKAQELLRKQYAPVGSAAAAGLSDAVRALEKAAGSGRDVECLLKSYRERAELPSLYTAAYRQYCWKVESVDQLKLAPFHLLATEGKIHTDQNHTWHMESLAEFCSADSSVCFSTQYKIVDLHDEKSVQSGVEWWEALTRSSRFEGVWRGKSFVFSICFS